MKKKILRSLIVLQFVVLMTACSKDDTISVPKTVSDFDGNIYHTITIGNQVWLQENLKVTTYLNGDKIPTNISNDQWGLISFGAYSTYDNSINDYESYGLLYNWYALHDSRKICPKGWHVPDSSDWRILTDFLGGDFIAGGKLKETGTSHWYSPNTGATNSSGFTALPGGRRVIDGATNFVGVSSEFWSSTEESLIFGQNYSTGFMTESFGQAYLFKTDGLSCRCIMD